MINKHEDSGYMRLAKEIYFRAVLDYYEAVISNNEGSLKEVTRFFENNPYHIFSKSECRYIKNKCDENIKVAEDFVVDFLNSGKRKIEIPKHLNKDVIQILCRIRYKEALYRLDKKHPYYTGNGEQYPKMLIRRKKS